MILKLFIGAAATLALSGAAYAQAAGAASTPSLGPTAGGVASGVDPYRPAGAPGAPGAAGGGAYSTDSSLTAGINNTLQAGQVPANPPVSDSALVGGASIGPPNRTPNNGGMRTPNPASGTYTGSRPSTPSSP